MKYKARAQRFRSRPGEGAVSPGLSPQGEEADPAASADRGSSRHELTQSPNATSDRRDSRRWLRRLRVEFWRPTGRRVPSEGYTFDLSSTGLYVRTPKPLPRGSRVRLEVFGRSESFVFEGFVARVTNPGPDSSGEAGMGVQFLTTSEIVEGLLPGAAGPPLADPPNPRRFARGPALGRSQDAPETPLLRTRRSAELVDFSRPSNGRSLLLGGGRALSPRVLRFQTLEAFLEAWDAGLRDGRIQIETETEDRPGREVDLHVYLPQSRLVLPARARVLRLRSDAPRASRGRAMSLVKLHGWPDLRLQLLDFLRQKGVSRDRR